MFTVDFLSTREIMVIHRDQLERYGGLDGIRDQNLLESAAAMPQLTFDGNYVHQDVSAMAAAYLFHIGKNHPFFDGNKRTATASALVFLLLNGFRLTVSDDKLSSIVLDVMEGKIGKDDLSELFRNNITPEQGYTE